MFDRSTSWVCKHQTRSIDPMPRDIQGATDWGRRLGFLEPAGSDTPLLNQAPVSSLEVHDIELKKARTAKLQQELDREAGELLSRREVEAREVQAAAEFRQAACQYPMRARAVIERHVTDPAAVEAIMLGLQPLAADLLNKADPHQVLKGRPLDEVRAILQARIEEILKCL